MLLPRPQVLKTGAVAAWDFFEGAAAAATGPPGGEQGEDITLANSLESLAPREWRQWCDAYAAARGLAGQAAAAMAPATAEAGPPAAAAVDAAVRAAAAGDWVAFEALAGGCGGPVRDLCAPGERRG